MSPRRWTIYTMAALLLAAPLAAQKPAAVEIGGFGQWTRFDDNAGRENARPENGLGFGGRAGVFLSPNWQVEADGYQSKQDRKLTEQFCCLGLFPDEVNALAFALRLNYNVPLGMGGRSHFIIGGGAVRTKYSFAGGNAPGGSVANYGASGLAGLRVGLMGPLALRVDGVVDYMPQHEPDANLNLHGRAGISLMLGGSQRAEPVAIYTPPPTPAPAPAATPRPAPAPPPAPVEHPVTVCIIDPAQPSGIRMQNALYRVEQRDTVVMQNGNRVPLSRVAGNANIARDAVWFTQGEPIELMIGTEAVRYSAYPAARPMDPDGLAYLGTINGYPVYADRNRLVDVIGDLNAARAGDPTRDVGDMLAERRDLREVVEALPNLYVPLERTGCVFQPMQVMQPIIKGS